MGKTQIQVTDETLDRLKWARALTLSETYDQTIRALIEGSELDVPDEKYDPGAVTLTLK